MILIDSCTNTSTLCSTSTTVSLIQFNGGSTHAGKRIAEQRTQEHISLSGMNLVEFHTHLLHNFHSIAETEDNAFLCSTHNMCSIVLIEVQATDRAAHFLVLKHTLCSIAEWYDTHSFTSDRHTCSQIVHIGIADIRCDVSMYPCIENTRTIDAKKHTQTVEFLGIVGMRKGIDTAVRIIVHISEHTIYYA